LAHRKVVRNMSGLCHIDLTWISIYSWFWKKHFKIRLLSMLSKDFGNSGATDPRHVFAHGTRPASHVHNHYGKLRKFSKYFTRDKYSCVRSSNWRIYFLCRLCTRLLPMYLLMVVAGAQRGKGSTPNHYGGSESQQGAPKSPNNVTSTYFDTVHFFRKTSGSNIGAVNLLLPPGAI